MLAPTAAKETSPPRSLEAETQKSNLSIRRQEPYRTLQPEWVSCTSDRCFSVYCWNYKCPRLAQEESIASENKITTSQNDQFNNLARP
jgi:hypothetical protein